MNPTFYTKSSIDLKRFRQCNEKNQHVNARGLLTMKLALLAFFLLFYIYSWATPPCQIITQSFQNSADGATSDPSSTGWSMSTVSGATYWACQSHRIKAQGLGAVGTWSSAVFNISGRPNVQVEVHVSAEGTLDTTEYIAIYYKLNGGALTLVQKFKGNNSGSPDVFSAPLNGSTVQIVVQIYTKRNGLPSYYYILNYGVNSQVNGCSLAVTPGVSGTITCTTPSVTLSPGSNTTSNVTYSWTGPNSFTSTSQNPVVTAAGTYNLTAKIAASSSTATGSIVVAQNTTAPGATAGVSGILTCSTTSATLSGSSGTSGVSYSWSGPNSFTSTLQNPVISKPGSYTLKVTNPTNGCFSNATATATQNISAPGATASVSGPITCSAASVNLSGGSSTSGVNYNWTGPNSFNSVSQNITVNQPGAYTLKVTNPTNGCISTSPANVTQNIIAPNIAATGASLPCSGSVVITGNSTVTGATFSWTGPNSFTSASQNPAVSGTGVYTLTVTDPANSCTASDTAIVVQGVAIPGVSVSVNGQLTCSKTSVTLSGSAGISGVSYSWSGPGNFTSSLQNPLVSSPGKYTLVVSNPGNGCNSSVAIDVVQDIVAPVATANGGLLTCTSNSVVLSGSSTTSGVTYSWTGPNGFASTLKNPTANIIGNYTLTVSNPVNGCVSTATASVVMDTIAPGAIASVSGPLNCNNSSVTLLGNSGTSGVIYTWVGPNSYTAALQNPAAGNPGTYTLTTVNSSNGCISQANITVVQNSTTPGATAGGGGTITCNTPSVTITASSTTQGVAFRWTGPNSFTSTFQNPTVSAGGLYTLTVSNPVNGCTSTATITVVQNTAGPGATTTGGALTCLTNSVLLSSSSSTPGVTYSWTGPGSFSSTSQNPSVNTVGNYTCTVINPLNGCVSSAVATVTQNITSPGVTATGGSLTCTATSVTLGGSSPTSGVTYNWSGPNSFTSNLQNPSVSALGAYTLTVTDPVNGCTSTVITSVTQNTTIPGLTASGGGTLTCTTTSLILSGSSETSGVTYSWSGPNGFTSALQNPSVSVPGIYNLTITSPINNCIATGMINVLQNTAIPGVKASSNGTITCATTTVSLTASSATPNTNFTWGGFAAGQNPVSTSSAGKYFVTATNPVNGCKSVDSTVVSKIASSTAFQFVYNNFSAYANGVVSDASTTNGWYLDRSGVPNASTTYVSNISPYFAIHSHRVEAVQMGGQGIWYTQVMNVAGKPDFQIGVKITSEGTLNSDEYVKLYYKLDGGSEVLWAQHTGYFGTLDFRSPVINANTVQIVVKIYNYSKGGAIVSNYYVEEEQLYIGGCGGTLLVYPAVSGNLTCANPSATLSATSSHSGATFQWTGPNNFTSTQQYPVVSTAGTYSVTATIAPSSVAIASISVIQNKTAPGASASVKDTLTCARTYVTLSGNSSTSGVSYSWTGPNGYVSSSQNPLVTAPGTYTLTVTNPANGCSSVASVNVIQNVMVSGASIIVKDTLTCIKTSVIISGNFTSGGVTYSWTGPNGFTSTLQNPSVSIPGLYTLVVMNPATGCTSSASTSVVQNTTLPGATAIGGKLTCSNNSVSLAGSSGTSGVTYNWSGPANFVSTAQNPTVSVVGVYTLTVTNPSNGCASTDTAIVSQYASSIEVTASVNNMLTCSVTSLTLSGNTNASNPSYQWSGPDGFTSVDQNPSVSKAGIYTLTVLSNGCSASDTVKVNQNIALPTATASKDRDTITCKFTSATLTGSSNSTNVSYSWMGPNGFTSAFQGFTTSVAGLYTLTVTSLVNGCTSSASANILQNTTKPGGVADSSGQITCSVLTVILKGSSPTGGATYKWIGPSGFTSTQQNPTTTVAGAYVLTITNPKNGCTSQDVATVVKNIIPPANVTSTVSGSINCNTASVTLTGNSSTSGITYNWSGPNGFSSILKSPVVTDSGMYVLTVINPVNGCITQSNITVNKNITPPNLTIAPVAALSVNNPTVSLTASSTTPNTTFTWTGFAAGQNPVTVSTPGKYFVLALNSTNGCMKKDSVTVNQEATVPNLTIAPVGIITCANTSVNLSASSTTSNTTITWQGYAVGQSIISVSNPGKYVVTATNNSSGLTRKDSVVISQNKTNPGVTASVSDKLTCLKTLTNIAASSATTGVTYSWSGPQSFYSTEQHPVVVLGGTYTVTAINPVNGCASTSNITVDMDTIRPVNVKAAVSNVLTCSVNSAMLSGSSGTSNVNFSWRGPNSYSTSEQNPEVTDPGFYVLTVSNPTNGCLSRDSIIVKQDTIAPKGVTATASNMITCTASSVTLRGTSTTQGVTYNWSGPGFTSTLPVVTVSNIGTYSLTVTNPANNCTVSKLVLVTLDNAKPAGITTSVSGTLTCSLPSVTISASSSTSTVAYSWSGPGSFTSTLQSPLVQTAGTYNVTITNTTNGCLETRSVTVTQDKPLPLGISTSVSGILTCSFPTRSLSGSSTTNGATYHWTGPSGFNSALASPNITLPGDYTLVVTHPTSGCTETRIVPVMQDITPPSDVDATVSSSLNCSHVSVTIAGYTSTGTVSYNWSGPNNFTSSTQSSIIAHSGTYKLTVTNTGNGCTAKDSVIVSENFQAPDVSVQGATITCSNLVVNINANSQTPGATYLWSTNVALSDRTLKNPSVLQPGDYAVTVTNPANGCTNTAMVTVGLNNVAPDLSVSASGTGILTCSNLSETLTTSSATPGAILSWTGFSGQNPVTVNSPGTYTATALNPANGCSISKGLVVTQNIVKPNQSVTASATLLTCNSPSVTLTSSTITPGTTLTWTGFATGNNPVTISNAGVYYATARTTSNGCARVDSVVVTQNKQKPDLITQGGTITCAEQVLMITASSTKPVTYLWSDNVILSDPTEQDALVFEAGEYSVTVTSTENGCTNSATVIVTLDNLPPVCNITSSDSPVALKDHTLNAQPINGGTYTWAKTSSGPGWSIVSGENTANLVYHAGDVGTSATFSLTVTSPNGCDPSVCQVMFVAVAGSKSAQPLASTAGDDNDLQVNVYPNPFSDKAFIEFTAAENAKVTIEMYSVSGNSFGTLFNNEVEASQSYKVEVDAGGKPSGTYYLIIKTNKKVYRQKLILVK